MRLKLTISIEDAHSVRSALRREAERMRNRKSVPRGETISTYLEQIAALEVHAGSITAALADGDLATEIGERRPTVEGIDDDEPRPSRGELG